MADIDSIISGVGGNTRADFSGLANLNKSYWEGLDQNYKQKNRDVFSEGLPRDPSGNIDYRQAFEKLITTGGAPAIAPATELVNAGLQQDRIQSAPAISNFMMQPGSPQQPIPGNPPSANRSGETAVAPALNRGGEQPQGQPQGGTTVMQVLAAQGIPNNQLEAASASVARQLGLQDPKAPINVQDPQVRNVLVPAVAQLKRMGIGQVAQNPQAPPQTIPDNTLGGLIPPGYSPGDYLARLQAIATSGKVLPDQLKILEQKIGAIQTAMQPTQGEKDFGAAQRNPKLTEFQNQQEAEKASAKGVAEADVKEQNDLISQGKAAGQRLSTLNTLSNIISSDKNLTLGFGAETALKAKMALQQLGINVGDLSGAEAIQKLNASLASEMTKSLASRPTQFEFKTFLGNNPGLLLDKSGNERLIGLFSQLAKREADLGKLARANRGNWENWDSVVEKYDAKNQIKDPATGKVITTDSIIAPGPKQAGPAAPATIASKADYDKLPAGSTFTGPDGKQWRKP